AFIQVLCRIIIKFFAGHDLSWHRGAGVIVAQHRALNLACLPFCPADTLFNHDLPVELCRLVDRGPKLFWCTSLRDSYRRSKIGGLHEHWKLQPTGYAFLAFLRIRFPVATEDCYVFNDRQSGSAEQRLHYIFIHARGRTEHPSTDVRQIREFEEALDRAVFAERAMENWEDDVDIDCSIGGTT